MVQLIQGSTNLLAVVVALWIVQPLLLPLIGLAFVPLAVSALGGGREMYLLNAGWTPRERERNYLRGLLTDREPAKEVRAFELTRFLRSRYDRLYAAYLADLRGMLRRRALVGLGTSGLTGLVVVGLLMLLVFMVTDGRMTLAQAGAALAAVLMLGFTVPMMLMAAGQLYECGHPLWIPMAQR